MSVVVAVLLSATYPALVILAAYAWCRWAKRRIAQLDTAGSRPPTAGPVIDTEPGFHRGDWDECELILAATNDAHREEET